MVKMLYNGTNLMPDMLAMFKVAQRFTCKHVTHDEIRRLRKRFACAFFRNEFLRGHPKKPYKDFVCHHIIPLALGGTNYWSNIVLIEPEIHAKIHAFIDMQSKPSPKRERTILIPILQGKIWTSQQLV